MTHENLIAFIRLVATMHNLQQEYFGGKKSVLRQVKVLEKKVDGVISAYKYDVVPNFVWQHRFVKVVDECRASQQKYFSERINLNLMRAKHNEGRLKQSLEWLEVNCPETKIETLKQGELL